jgi:hypothetical protein
MRISRGNEVIGERSIGQIKKGVADGTLLLTDFYYDEESSEWLPIADFLAVQAAPKPEKRIGPPCYCGSGLSFQACHGNGSQY